MTTLSEMRNAWAALPPSTAAAGTTRGEQAYLEVRALLMRGAFAPGDGIPVRVVSELLGIGITPVREALQRLAAERVLEAEANRGVRVPERSRAELEQLYETRLLLEAEAAALAARRISPIELRAVRQTFARIVEAADAGDARACLTANTEFHFLVYAASGLPPLVHCIEQLWLQSGPLLLRSLAGKPLSARTFFGTTRRAHTGLLEAMSRHDADAARMRMQEILYAGLESSA